MSDKQNLQKALKALDKAKKEDTKAVTEAASQVNKTRQEQMERQSRQD